MPLLDEPLVMGQYRPDFRVGTVGEGRVSDGPFSTEIDRRPTPQEIRQAYQIATGAGLYRFA